ncbi:SRPBCC family protein [Rhodopseudomonas sp. B29]|uniref:SRPBCC family protein n=1 Tax=Rhodopseudomonas sp. B29 TaxID=95607 RepID=UPI000347C393|nr:SRPBCC family protein [Rhodopseudomonas sp. B29]
MADVTGWVPQTVTTIYIAASAERVWQALTSPEFSRQYFCSFAVEVEPRVGGRLTVTAPDGSPHISGEVISWDPPHRLSMTWNVGWPGLIEALGGTLVTYEIEPAGETVRLTMTEAHELALDDDILSGGRLGWPAILSSLKSLLETGRAPAIAMQPPLRMIEALRKLGVRMPGMRD